MKSTITILFFISVISTVSAQRKYINFLSIHQQISNSVDEHERQVEISENTEQNLVLEQQNKVKNEELKTTYGKIRGRLNTVAPYMQALPVGASIYRTVTDIVEVQKQILALLREAPFGIVEIYQPYLIFAQDAYETLGLAAGIILSYGSVAQMEQSDRIKLLDYTKNEFYRIYSSALRIHGKLRYFINNQRYQANGLKNWVTQDVDIVKDIMKDAKDLGI